MRMKRPAGEKRDGSAALFAFSVIAAVCADHFARVRDSRETKADRAGEVCGMVFRNVCIGRNYAGLADVSVFEVKSRSRGRELSSRPAAYESN